MPNRPENGLLVLGYEIALDEKPKEETVTIDLL